MSVADQPKVKRPLIVAALIFLCFAFLGAAAYSYFSPQFTIRAIREAVKAGDAERLGDLIDFDSVRQGFKDELKAMMIRRFEPQLSGNPFSALGIVIAGAVIDGVVDTLVSPASIAQMLSQGQFALNHASQAKRSQQGAPASEGGTEPKNRNREPNASAKREVVVTEGYDGYSLYRVTVKPVGAAPEERIEFLLRRQGPFTWRLSRIVLPNSMLLAYAEPEAGLFSIKSSSLDLDPNRGGVFVLSATLRNRASFPQETPYLELTLTDQRDRTVVRRVLTPTDYFSVTNGKLRDSIAARSQIAVRVYFTLTHLYPTGYKIYLFYPSQDSRPTSRQIDPNAIHILLHAP